MKDYRFITFAGKVQPSKKSKKDVRVQGYVRKGKFVQSFQRKQLLNDENKELAKKVAVGSLVTLGGVLGVGLAGAAVVKLRYNRNLVKFGQQIKANKIPRDMKAPEKYYVAPRNIGDKDSMDFFIGPLSSKGSSGGAGLMVLTKKTLKKTKLKDQHELIPLTHNYQVSGDHEFQLYTSAVDATRKAVADGYNMDSVLMSKEIFKWHTLNPTKPIKLITHSAGGFQSRDVPHILKAAGVPPKLMKVFSMGSPDFGLVDDIVPSSRIMNSDDLYTNKLKILADKSMGSLPSLNRNTTYVGNGYTPAFEKIRYNKALKEADLTGYYGDVDLPKNQQRLVAHSLEAYMNGETLASKKNLDLLKNFLAID